MRDEGWGLKVKDPKSYSYSCSYTLWTLHYSYTLSSTLWTCLLRSSVVPYPIPIPIPIPILIPILIPNRAHILTLILHPVDLPVA